MCKSEDSADAGGFAFGATGAGDVEDEGVVVGAGFAGVAAAGFGVAGGVSFFLLENIFCSFHVVFCVDRLTA
ncbi:hypothetical protein GCM10007939_06300 [Amylibacter marinus]|uniref:Uncharacterized protein n=1 Tax=Amylibacter marinus TaxID=1475483 RepID=A0ABQ5VSE9_9RHOB|nr:hypothetical protein GCM10007939_06300 [Amylibacter marinus]